jgi:uncharacterized protein (DUF1810 family)
MTMYSIIRIYLVTSFLILRLRLKLHHQRQQQKQHAQRWQRLEHDQNNLNAKLTGLRLQGCIETYTQFEDENNQVILHTQQLIFALIAFSKAFRAEKELTNTRLKQYNDQIREIRRVF